VARRILVCSGYVPFNEGGAERLMDALVAQLELRGHQVATVRLPFIWQTAEQIVQSYAAWRLFDLAQIESRTVDTVIPLKFPAHVLAHGNKVVWLIQQFRQVYDLFGTSYSPYDPTSREDNALRDTIQRMDTRTLGEAQRLCAISANVAHRLFDHNGLTAQVLYPPPPLDGRFSCSDYGDYVLSLSRLDELKRVEYLIEAMSLVRSPVRCRIAGRGPDAAALQGLARRLHVTDRVEFLGDVSDDQALELYAGALAVYYAPYDEDYGLATFEAMRSAKPVLTFADSGGVLEFVDDGITGYVAPSRDARAIAERLDELYADRERARAIGQRALERVENIHWDRVVHTLLGE
jgi:glycosyltransferase involved in cell wall biosynthesis